MSAPAYLPLFGSDYLADTRHLSTEEHGAYLLLMMAAWRQDDCDLPADDKKLSRIVGLSLRKWLSIKDTILDFWTVENGRIWQPRLRKERGYADQKSDSNRENARKRWAKQVIENIDVGICDRISDRNAPQPQPQLDVVAKATPSPRAKRAAGGRLSVDWSPSDLPPAVADLAALWPPGRVDRELEAFRDYWTARSKDACRTDWDKVWHNRIRDIHDRVLRDNRNAAPARNNESTREIGMRIAAELGGGAASGGYAPSRSPVDLLPSPGAPRWHDARRG